MFEPFLKWAGGKRQLLPFIRKLYPDNIGTYYEPFLGGGAVFFDLAPKDYIISDSNPELINVYKTISIKSNEVIAGLEKMKYHKEYFYRIRKLKFNELSNLDAAIRTIYLNRTCFNGLYRVNKEGHFNVPIGKYKNPDFVQKEKIAKASKLLKFRKIKCKDFRDIINYSFKKNDLIFLDPPYIPLEGYADFKRYTSDQFHLESHQDLSKIFNKLSKKKVKMILTNSNTEITNSLYKGFDKQVIQSLRNINSKATNRRGEDLIIYANI